MDDCEPTFRVAKKFHHPLRAFKKVRTRIFWIVPTKLLPVHRVIQPLNGAVIAIEEVPGVR